MIVSGESPFAYDGKSVIAAHQSSDIGLWDHIIQQFDTLGAKLITYIYHGVSAGGVESGDPILSAVLQHLAMMEPSPALMRLALMPPA
mgnify:CR=1 FL=1